MPHLPMTLSRRLGALRPVLGLMATIALVTASCRWGVRPGDLPVANGPGGAMVAVTLSGGEPNRRGELIAADSSGVTIMAPTFVATSPGVTRPIPRLSRLAWGRIAALDVDELGASHDVRIGEPVPGDKRERLALVSRFPQGLSGELLARMLAILDQDALEEIR